MSLLRIFFSHVREDCAIQINSERLAVSEKFSARWKTKGSSHTIGKKYYSQGSRGNEPPPPPPPPLDGTLQAPFQGRVGFAHVQACCTQKLAHSRVFSPIPMAQPTALAWHTSSTRVPLLHVSHTSFLIIHTPLVYSNKVLGQAINYFRSVNYYGLSVLTFMILF